MIDTVIDLINGGFDGLHNEEIILGIAQRIYRTSKNGFVEGLPGIVKLGTDEAIYAGVNDIKSIMIYHKTNTATLSFIPRGGYGDSRISEDNIQCSLIAAWDTRKLKIYGADMGLLLRARMPQFIVDVPGIDRVTIQPNSMVLSAKQIFDSEYTLEKDVLLPAYISFVQINYTVQIKYDQSCINKCINCS